MSPTTDPAAGPTPPANASSLARRAPHLRFPWAPLAAVASALVSLLTLFLPAASVSLFGGRISQSFLEASADEAGIILALLLLTIALCVAAFLVSAAWARIAAGVLAVLTGLFLMVDGFANIGRVAGHGASPGIGLVLMGLAGLALAAAGVLMFLARRGGTPGERAKVTQRVD
ncbi:hypothetical protein NJC10_07275 [Micrococcus sp. M4NT]|uniref:hypothetical protein n=1 Tax=Micrococcus sp. M4NT TaxID=2957501 RepID=UPI0029B85F24|nr:hypothetical protein [Micrococcus sp. M4NT]MDX2341466.1 hypothetical protein [Micrococcus sp. M4NT]